MMLLSSPIPLQLVIKIWLVLQRNYHSKQSSTRVDKDYAAVSQYEGKVLVC